MKALPKVCARPPAPWPWVAWINQIHAAGGFGGSTTMVVVFVVVVCLCCMLRLVWSLSLVVCQKVRENNLKVRL